MKKVDYKKDYKDLYGPKTSPSIIEVPSMNFIMVEGKGNPNEEEGEYNTAVELLYTFSYTIKMSNKSGEAPVGYYDYVVPPLEGLWWFSSDSGLDFSKDEFYHQVAAMKDHFHWISMIRQPEFVTDDVFEWAKDRISKKKPHLDLTKAYYKTFTEGLCVQAMHIGPYDDEPATVKKIETFIHENGLTNDMDSILPDGNIRRHHEIYLSDPRKANPSKLQTIIRHPVKYI